MTFNTRYVNPGDVFDLIKETYTFTIKAIAEGGAFATTTVTVNIIVCGFEELTPTSNEALSAKLEEGDSTLYTYDIPPMFESNDTDCPPLGYKLKQSTWTKSATNAWNV